MESLSSQLMQKKISFLSTQNPIPTNLKQEPATTNPSTTAQKPTTGPRFKGNSWFPGLLPTFEFSATDIKPMPMEDEEAPINQKLH